MRGICIILIAVLFIGCSNPITQKIIQPDNQEVLPFTVIEEISLPDDIKESIFVPFQENNKYYIVNYKGERISKLSFDEIRLVDVNPFYWGKNNNQYKLYSFPDKLMIQEEFEIIPTSPSYPMTAISVSEAVTIYGVKVNREISKSAPLPFSLMSTKTEQKFISEYYFFNKNQVNPTVKSYMLPRDLGYYRCDKITKDKIATGLPYVKIINRKNKFQIISQDGTPKVNRSFDEVVPLADNHLAILNSSGKYALYNMKNNIESKYIYERIDVLYNCPGYFSGKVASENNIAEYHTLNENGEIVYKGKVDEFSCVSEHYFKYRIGGQYGVINVKSRDTLYQRTKTNKFRKFKHVNATNEIGEVVENGYVIISLKGDTLVDMRSSMKIMAYGNRLKKEGLIIDEEVKIPKEKIKVKPINQWKLLLVYGNGLYGLFDNQSRKWLLPVSNRKITQQGRTSYHDFVMEYEGDSISVIFNDKLEILHEGKTGKIEEYLPRGGLPIQSGAFDLEAIPKEIRPKSMDVRKPYLNDAYTVLQGKEYCHVYNNTGQYISSHKGSYAEIFKSLNQFYRLNNYNLDIPIGKFIDNGDVYYVRLTDGFEYRTKPRPVMNK